MKKRGTRKSDGGKVLTIPELRQSMDYISNYSSKLVSGTKKSVKELAKDFAREWKKVFGKTLSPKIAESYVRHIMGMKKSKGTRRKQRGGAQDMTLTGAPINYETRPGVPLPYGNFLEYVNKGFWNPEPAILQDCGRQVGVMPTSDISSNQAGGGVMDWLRQSADAISFRPFVAQNPSTPQQDTMSAWKGQGIGPGPESWQQAWQPKMGNNPLPPMTAVAVYDRDIKQDVITR
jgi:hypothetical protein